MHRARCDEVPTVIATPTVRFLAVGCIGSMLLASCAVSVGPGDVPQSVVESQSAKVLAAATGQSPPTVTCSRSLPARIGASIDCTLTASGSSTKYPVHITVNSITGGMAHFHVQVGGSPVGGGASTTTPS